MDEPLRAETERLIRSWERHRADFLDRYLVSSVEDPRRNLQSVLMRHFLLTALFGARFTELMEQEILFVSAVSWLLGLDRSEPDALAATVHALRQGSDNAEGRSLPRFVVSLFQSLPTLANGLTVPNYIAEYLNSSDPGSDWLLETFMRLWRDALAPLPRAEPPTQVLEIACGSANDYRYLHASGIARFLEYAGLDLSPKNIDNARASFPSVRFEVGNVFDLRASAQSFDHVLVQDLFEHLSLQGLERALPEACRVTRHSLCLGFFNMDEVPEHVVRPLDEYHWNTLSLDRVRASLLRCGFRTQVFHLDTYLRWLLPGQGTHNANAYTLVATRREGVTP